MFRFIHGYLPGLWKAQVDAGLVRESDGIRFCQNIMIKNELKFNNLAKKGGELYQILAERKCPFFIDRLQGGVYIDEYEYDQDLLNEYKELLGDNFWGFQMHEWLSNYRNDALKKLGDLPESEWNEQSIKDYLYKKFPFPFLMLESMTAKEMAEKGKPKTAKQLYDNMTAIYKKRQKIGELIPADSGFLAYNFEVGVGATKLMPEVGAQTPDTKIQICYARGMTRVEGRSFGVYYEPWGGIPFSACCYEENSKNEWGIGDSKDFPFETQGANGGSSRSLQKRIFLYAYLSGAEFISEEWGLCNVFNSWKTFELSPYGIVKKEFIEFTKKYADIGDKLTLFGVVLPKDLMVLDNLYSDDVYCGFNVKNERLNFVKQGIRELFCESLATAGIELGVLKNSSIPDVLDMLNDGQENISNYKYLIDLTCDDDFKNKHINAVDIKSVKEICKKELPCYVEGNAHWLINECLSGGYYLTVFNHGGVMRSVEKGEVLLEEGKTTVTINAKNLSLTLLEGNATLNNDSDNYLLTIPSGGWAFIKLN